VYAAIPFTAALGNAFVATPVGSWVFGPGLLLVVLLGAAGILGWLRRRGAPLWAYLLIGLAGAAYFVVLGSLAVRPLERVHRVLAVRQNSFGRMEKSRLKLNNKPPAGCLLHSSFCSCFCSFFRCSSTGI
jgi:hypothetical protein